VSLLTVSFEDTEDTKGEYIRSMLHFNVALNSFYSLEFRATLMAALITHFKEPHVMHMG
jgi:hypothetical protein